MKITIEPSEDQSGQEYPYAKVTIELPDDDLSLSVVIENMIEPALIAWGFLPDSVKRELNANSPSTGATE